MGGMAQGCASFRAKTALIMLICLVISGEIPRLAHARDSSFVITDDTPTLDKKSGNAALFAMWRKKFGLNEPAPVKEEAKRARFQADLEEARREEIEDLDPEELSARKHFERGEALFKEKKLEEVWSTSGRAASSIPSRLPRGSTRSARSIPSVARMRRSRRPGSCSTSMRSFETSRCSGRCSASRPGSPFGFGYGL